MSRTNAIALGPTTFPMSNHPDRSDMAFANDDRIACCGHAVWCKSALAQTDMFHLYHDWYTAINRFLMACLQVYTYAFGQFTYL